LLHTREQQRIVQVFERWCQKSTRRIDIGHSSAQQKASCQRLNAKVRRQVARGLRIHLWDEPLGNPGRRQNLN
jgi:hypothetical protein